MVFYQDRVVVFFQKPARSPGEIAAVHSREIKRRFRLGALVEINERGKAIIDKQRTAYGEGAVTVVVFSESLPALAVLAAAPQVKTGLLYLIVRLVTRVDHPTHPVQLEDE